MAAGLNPDFNLSDAPAAELWIEVNGVESVVPLIAASYRLGRAPTNQLAYPTLPGLSREHLALERDGQEWLVRDLGSTHGSTVNGERLSAPRVLRAGDRITAGGLTAVYREEGSSAQAAVELTNERSDAAGHTTIIESLEGLMAQESREGGRHMQALITAGRELATHLPLDKLFDLILKLSIDTAGAVRGVLMTIENGELQTRSTWGRGLRISSHVRDLVVRERRSLLVHDAARDDVFAGYASIIQSEIRSMMAAPLQTEERVIGLIYVDSPRLVKKFTKDDLNLLTILANMAAVRIENARLAEVEQAERVRARELEHAAAIQRSMLPGRFPAFPGRRDFELHAAMVPAKEVGGDLFDYFLLDSGRVAFVVGDVSGKGVPSALFMAIVRTLLRATAPHQPSAGECLTHLNQALAEQNEMGMFVTLFYGILDPLTGELEYANAGHNPPYVFSPDGRIRALTNEADPILGVFEGRQYRTRRVNLAPREGVLTFTDGVTEATNRESGFYEESRLEMYLATHASLPVAELVRGLLAEVEQFVGGAARADDITVLAVRWNGAQAAEVDQMPQT